MSITFLSRDTEFGEDVDFQQLLESGSVHYISIAMPGLTVASANIQFAGNFDVDARNRFMMRVNRAQETGTLYPGVNITLLPSPSASYYLGDSHVYNDGDYSEWEVINHIKDAFKANSEYIKSDTMYFDFRNLCVSEEHYVICLIKTVNELKEEGIDLPEIITWYPPNISSSLKVTFKIATGAGGTVPT